MVSNFRLPLVLLDGPIPLQAAEGVIEPLTHAQLLWLFAMLALLLFTARALGELARRFDLPAVVGELTAGVLLGPSVVDATSIVFGAIFEPGTPLDPQFHLVEVVAWIGLIMLIILTGLETDLDLIISRGTESTIIAAASIVVPFALGFAFAWYLPDRFIAGPGQRLVFSLFVGTALSISAIPVIAKILMDMGAIRRDFGQISLAAGMINDTVGWIMLALVAGLARTGQIDLSNTALTVLYLIVFLGIGLTLGRRIVSWLLIWVDNAIGGQVAKISTVVILALGVGALTHALHLEAVLGAFVVGILAGQVKRFDYATEHTFEVVTIGVFAPIFFATAGLRVDLSTLLDPVVFAVAVAALGIAIVGKFVGSYVGAYIAGLSHWEGITLGAGLNARGAMEIIVAMIGLGLGVLTIEMYSIIVMIAVVTSLMAPPLLKWSLPHVELTSEERARLDREERLAESFLGTMTTILLPTRCSVDSQYAAKLLGYMTRGMEIEVTHMFLQRGGDVKPSRFTRLPRMFRRGESVEDVAWEGVNSTAPGEDDGMTGDPTGCLDLMDAQLREVTGTEGRRETGGEARRLVRRERSTAEQTILEEATGGGYGMLVLGASERGAAPEDPVFGDVIDTIVRDSPCPIMVVDAHQQDTERDVLQDDHVERILLPTVGAEYNRHAAEIAFAIARHRNAIVEVVHVINKPKVADRFVDQPDVTNARRIGEEIVDEEADMGRGMGAEVTTRVIVTENEPQEEIVEMAAEQDDVLVVLGTNIRPVSQRAFIGHRSEYIIRNADCPVAVVISQ